MSTKQILQIVESKNVTAYEIAQATGLSEPGVRKILQGETKRPNPATLMLIKNYLDDKYKTSLVSEVKDKPITGYYYPNVSGSAGLETEIINDELNKIPISIPGWGTGIDFINVYGDSMYPKFCSGEIIGIKEVQDKFLHFGHAYVVIMNDGEVYIKYIKPGKDDNHWILESENEKYPSREFHLKLIHKVFIVKGVLTKTTM